MPVCPETGGMAITSMQFAFYLLEKESRLRVAKRATRVPPGPILGVNVFATNTILSLILHPIQSPGNI